MATSAEAAEITRALSARAVRDASPVTDQLLREAYALLTLIPPDREWTKRVLFPMRALHIIVVLWVIESATLRKGCGNKAVHRVTLTGPMSERPVSYLKRRYGFDRTLFDTLAGAQAWCGLGVLAHNTVKIATLVPASGPRPAPSTRPHRPRPARSSAPDATTVGRPPPDPLFDHTAA